MRINNRRVAPIHLDDSDSEGKSCDSRKRRNNRRMASIHLEDSSSDGNSSNSSSSVSFDFTPHVGEKDDQEDQEDHQEESYAGACTQDALEALVGMGNNFPTTTAANTDRPPASFADLGYASRVAPAAPAFAPTQALQQHIVYPPLPPLAPARPNVAADTRNTSTVTAQVGAAPASASQSLQQIVVHHPAAPLAPAGPIVAADARNTFTVASQLYAVPAVAAVPASAMNNAHHHNTRSSSASITQVEPTLGTNLSDLLDISNINALSSDILNGTTGGIELTDEEKLACVNSIKYNATQASVAKRFLETIKAFCGPKLKRLAEIEFKDENGILRNGFIAACQGEKHQGKKTIINYAMTAVVKTWRMTRKYIDKQVGGHYEPGSFVNFVKSISKLLQCCSSNRPNTECQFNLFLDFKGTGEWISILQQTWRAEMMLNPEFGRKPFAGKFDPSAPEKVEEALRQGTLSLDNHHHVLLLTIYCLGYHWWLRGSTEQTDRVWSEVSFFMHSNGNNRAKFILSEGKSRNALRLL